MGVSVSQRLGEYDVLLPVAEGFLPDVGGKLAFAGATISTPENPGVNAVNGVAGRNVVLFTVLHSFYITFGVNTYTSGQCTRSGQASMYFHNFTFEEPYQERRAWEIVRDAGVR